MGEFTTSRTQLSQLASTLQNQVTEIQRYLETSKQEHPSFTELVPKIDWNGVENTRIEALETLGLLRDLISTPEEVLTQTWETDFISRDFLSRYNVYDLVPVGGTKTYAEISTATGVRVSDVRRLLRHAMVQHIFHEPEQDVVAHTTVSRLLAENSHVRDYFWTKSQQVWPATTRAVDAVQKWPNGRSGEESGFYLAHGMSLYESHKRDPAIHKRYDNAMPAMTARGNAHEALFNGLDWAGLGKATVVDMAGGIGTSSIALAKNFPQLNFIVQDRPEVIANATIDDPELKSRITFSAHDFFDPQPITDAAVFLVRRVFIEWNDADVAKILRNLIPGLRNGARIVIADFHASAPGKGTFVEGRRQWATDMLLLTLQRAESRSEAEYRDVFANADPGFRVRKFTEFAIAGMMMLEADWSSK